MIQNDVLRQDLTKKKILGTLVNVRGRFWRENLNFKNREIEIFFFFSFFREKLGRLTQLWGGVSLGRGVCKGLWATRGISRDLGF